jgi:hypothetical protein
MKKYEKGGAVEEPKKDEKGNRTKYVESFPPSMLQKGAAKASQLLDKLGFRQDEAYEGKSAKEPVKKAKGGMITARGQGKVMKTKSCKMY